MKKTLILVMLCCLCGGTLMAYTPKVERTEQPNAQTTMINWTTIEKAAQLKDNSKLYFVDFYTTWCGWCKRMDSDTFTDTIVAKILNKYYVPVKFNAEGKSEFVWHGTRYAGAAVPPGTRPTLHSFTKAMLGPQLGFPSFMVFDSNQKTMKKIEGYQTIEDLTIILWYMASGDHHKYSFEKYRTIFNKDIRPKMIAALK